MARPPTTFLALGCFGNSFATGASARTAALKNNVGAASPGRPFVALISDCPQNVSLAMI